MRGKALALVCAGLVLCTGCEKRALLYMHADKSSTALSGGTVSYASLAVEPVALAATRYLAVRHELEIVVPGAKLGKSLEAVTDFCGTIHCEVLESSVLSDTGDAIPSGSVSLRMAPADLDKLLEFAAQQGKITRHSTKAEDKTTDVVDLEAKLKNQTEFRDNLRKMMAKPGVNVADLLQIQEKLAEAQAELDSEAARRKVLANETEKVWVGIEFRAERNGSSRGVFAPINEALRVSGTVLADSVAVLITAVAAIIPWLIVIVPGGWFIVKLWRKWGRKKAAE